MNKNIFSALDSDDEVDSKKQAPGKVVAKPDTTKPSTDKPKPVADKSGIKKVAAPAHRIPGSTGGRPYTGEGVLNAEEKEQRKPKSQVDKPKKVYNSDAPHPQGDKHSGVGYGYPFILISSAKPKKDGANKGHWNKNKDELFVSHSYVRKGDVVEGQKEVTEGEVIEVVKEEVDTSITLEEYYKSKNITKAGVIEEKKAERTITGGKVEGIEVMKTREFTKVDDSKKKEKTASSSQPATKTNANANLLNFHDKPEQRRHEKGGKKEVKKVALEMKEEDFPSL